MRLYLHAGVSTPRCQVFDSLPALSCHVAALWSIRAAANSQSRTTVFRRNLDETLRTSVEPLKTSAVSLTLGQTQIHYLTFARSTAATVKASSIATKSASGPSHYPSRILPFEVWRIPAAFRGLVGPGPIDQDAPDHLCATTEKMSPAFPSAVSGARCDRVADE
jgi:hypothetical protein